MKLISAQHSLEDLSAEVEKRVQQEKCVRRELLIVCLEEHESDVRSLTDIEVDLLDEQKLSEENVLNHYQLDTSSEKMYANVLLRGGFLLLDRSLSN